MIHGFSGRTGAGKSYECVVNHIIPMVTQKKRKIVTNIPLNIEKICSVYGEHCRELIHYVDGNWHDFGGERPFSRVEHYHQFDDWQNEQGQRCAFFIDEAHLCLPTGGTDKRTLEFYSLHRQYGFDIYLMTQHFRKIHRDIRDLVDNHYRCIKKSFLGQPDKYVLKIHNGGSSSNSTVVNTVEREYESRWFPFYKSHTKSEKSITEDSSEDIKKWWDNWYMKGSAIMLGVFLFILISAINTEPKNKSVETTAEPKIETIQQAQQPVAQQQTVLAQFQQPQNPNVVASVQQMPVQNESIRPTIYEQRPEPPRAAHPFHKVALHINGFSEYTDRGTIVKNYWIGASQNGQLIFEMSLRDLYLAGYDVMVRSECMIEVSFKDTYHDYITCDSPRIDVMPSESMPVANNMSGGEHG
ncbi:MULTISPECIES: zonular occludens toxin domain-containing protein [Pseudoalteromonas]|uniref:Zona occludens toxin N-terminal domain-containing protein n=1 Tax=Pseudoalteromonas amylolytica TaxID=1859457 RepID=A0A1S1N1M7_9GAMM|nr:MULTISPECIES: zonular occludens toxin domain-containing protein [Pseudoalteromonas]OHU85488.1 hypothetical protein BFC16_19255 [Pseudoalteromonas sp. JW3]OHU93253.1 hypothetical protein BET10_01830 [Pseudoalteromonas amylolytica]